MSGGLRASIGLVVMSGAVLMLTIVTKQTTKNAKDDLHMTPVKPTILPQIDRTRVTLPVWRQPSSEPGARPTDEAVTRVERYLLRHAKRCEDIWLSTTGASDLPTGLLIELSLGEYGVSNAALVDGRSAPEAVITCLGEAISSVVWPVSDVGFELVIEWPR